MPVYIIKVIPNARKNMITVEDDKIKIHVMSPAVDGKANKSVLKALAEHFGINIKAIKIIKGEKSREKVISVNVAG